MNLDNGLPFFAEDLGSIAPDGHEVMQKYIHRTGPQKQSKKAVHDNRAVVSGRIRIPVRDPFDFYPP